MPVSPLDPAVAVDTEAGSREPSAAGTAVELSAAAGEVASTAAVAVASTAVEAAVAAAAAVEASDAAVVMVRPGLPSPVAWDMSP